MKKKGFTLVELLAVIAILAILVILALPNVIGLYNSAKQETFLTEVKSLASSAEKQYMSNQVKGDNTRVFSSRGNKLEMTGKELDYYIELDNNGKIKTLKVSNGTWMIKLPSGKDVADLTISDLIEGILKDSDYISINIPKPVYCTYDGELTEGTEYINGQYTYRYKQEGTFSNSGLEWSNIYIDGWGVQLTDRNSEEEVTSELCTYINDKPIISMSYMFLYSKATSIDVSSFNTSNVTNMKNMFSADGEIKGLEYIDTSKVTDMSGMFSSSKATTLDVSHFDTSNVTDMSYMFNISHATEIKGLENFDTSKVTDMRDMFSYSQATSIDVSSFNTSNVTNMKSMFGTSYATTIKGLEKFDTSKVTDMSNMFSYSQATELDISNFNTSKVKNMQSMFAGSQKLKTIYASDKFVTSAVVEGHSYMFSGCTSLVGGSGTTYTSSIVDKTYARIDGGTSSHGYFTAK